MIACLLVACCAGLFTATRPRTPLTGGDEVSYLLEARSLLDDGDRDLTNQLADPKVVSWAMGESVSAPLQKMTPHARNYTERGLVSWHAFAPSALLIPGVWAGKHMTNYLLPVRATMVLIYAGCAAWTALLLVRLMRRVHISWTAAALGMAAVFLTLPLLGQADQIYAEMPGSFFLLASLGVLTGGSKTRARMAMASILAWLAPWFNMRFLVLAFGCTVAVLVVAADPEFGWRRGLRDIPREVKTWWNRSRRSATAVGFASAVLPALALLGLLAATNAYWYGSPSLGAASFGTPPPTGGPVMYRAWVGNLLSSDWGVIPYGPVYLAAIASLGVLCVLIPRWTALAAGTMAAYTMVLGLTGVFSPGASYAGRYHTAMLPLCAIALAVLLSALKWSYVVVGSLMVWSSLITADWLRHSPYNLANVGDPQIATVAATTRLWPNVASLGAEIQAPPAAPPQPVPARLGPGSVASAVSVPVPSSLPLLGSGDAPAIRAAKGSSGLLIRSTPIDLDPKSNVFQFTFTIEAQQSGGTPGVDVAQARILDAASGKVLARYSVRSNLSSDHGLTPVTVIVLRPASVERAVIEVSTTGKAEVTAGPTLLMSTPIGGHLHVTLQPPYPGRMKAGLWTVLLAAAIALTWVLERRQAAGRQRLSAPRT